MDIKLSWSNDFRRWNNDVDVNNEGGWYNLEDKVADSIAARIMSSTKSLFGGTEIVLPEIEQG